MLYRSFIIVNRNESELDDKLFNTALNTFLISTSNAGYTKTIPCFRRIANNNYIFPKASTKKLIDCKLATKFKISHIINNASYSKWNFGPKLTHYNEVKLNVSPNQFRILTHIIDKYLKRGILGCTAVAGAGTGKTRLGLALIKMLGYRGLIVVPSNKVIMYQWFNECANVFEGGNIKITMLGDGHKDISGDIVIAMVGSLLNQSPLDFDEFKITVIDECHSFCTEKYSQVFWMYQSPITVGFTATPAERSDGFDKMLEYHLGPTIICRDVPGYNLEYEAETTKFDVTVAALLYEGHPKYVKPVLDANGKLRTPETIGLLLNDPHRNALIIGIIYKQIIEKRHTFVFSDLREHCRHLEQLFMAKYGDGLKSNINDDSRDDSGFYILIGGIKKEQLDQANIQSNFGTVIFTTHMYSRQAINIQYMDTEILAAPRRNGTTQLSGRITRFGSDINIKRRIYDIVDVDSALVSQYNSSEKMCRLKKYNELGFKVIEVNKKWSDYNMTSSPDTFDVANISACLLPAHILT